MSISTLLPVIFVVPSMLTCLFDGLRFELVMKLVLKMGLLPSFMSTERRHLQIIEKL